ncbi:hypothetical protein ACIBEJ_10305 [Nonomuraea sp. NPDC050790]|uniref:hypothetical protein n=1 Tax=Nonomuraea sp. NPDC050790 TaxID=3364371 RepID=UPI0037A0F3F1
MAIKPGAVTSETGEFKFDNGDFAALNALVELWGFKDYESALKFAMAALLKADNRRLYIEQNGSHALLTPGENLLKPPSENRRGQGD